MTITDVLAALGLLLTAAGLFYNGSQVRIAQKTAHGQFMLQLKERFDDFDSVDKKLKLGGWVAGSKGPTTDDEWREVMRYMGILEQLWYLISDGILSADVVDRAYSHRIVPIITNPAVYERCFVRRKVVWQDFISLHKALEKKPVFQFLAQDRIAQQSTTQSNALSSAAQSGQG